GVQPLHHLGRPVLRAGHPAVAEPGRPLDRPVRRAADPDRDRLRRQRPDPDAGRLFTGQQLPHHLEPGLEQRHPVCQRGAHPRAAPRSPPPAHPATHTAPPPAAPAPPTAPAATPGPHAGRRTPPPTPPPPPPGGGRPTTGPFW